MHGTVITMDPDRRVLEDAAVIVDGDRIVAVGDSAELLAAYAPAETIDCTGQVVLPGLVDAHGHGGHALMKTIGVDTLSFWMRLVTRVYFEHTSADYWSADAALTAMERARFGVTTGISVLGSQPRSDEPELGAGYVAAYARSGLRVGIGVGPAGLPWPREVGTWRDDGHRRRRVGLDEMMAGAEATVREWHGAADGRIRVYVTPYTMVPSLNPGGPLPPDQTLTLEKVDLEQSERVRDLARRAGTRIRTDAFGGMVALAHARDPHALLGPDVHFQHGFGLTPDEVRILAETGTSVTHGPGVVVGALRGRCPVPELDRRGRHDPAITSDGCAPMSSVRPVHRHAPGADPRPGPAALRDVYLLPPGKLLEMVTIDAARAIGWDDEIGSLEVGKAADVIVVDTRQAHLQPLHMPVQALVYKAAGQDVVTTVVGGDVVMRDRVLTRIDPGEVLDAAVAEARRAWSGPGWRPS